MWLRLMSLCFSNNKGCGICGFTDADTDDADDADYGIGDVCGSLNG